MLSSLIGLWMYTAVIYHGSVMPPPNTDLKIYYTFETEGRNEIFYYRENETGFCRRWANYSVNETEITQTVTELDPQNASECSNDTDMQVGNVSHVKYEIKDGKLYLHLSLGEEELIYIWEKQM